MNEQNLQQILLQQALATAATAAIINTLLNPQQASGLANANALTDSSNDLQQLQHLQLLQQQQDSRQSPATTSPAVPNECNTSRIQDLLLQIQQQTSLGQSPLALSLNLGQQAAAANLASPIRSPAIRLSNQEANSATTSNTPANQQASPIKKLKRHHHHHQHQQPHQQHQSYNHNRSSEATSKSQQHSTLKNHHQNSISSGLASRGGANIGSTNNTTSSTSSSSTFIANNVGLPRKLVRGQDVWLGRGAEQTRQILKCMWCGQSFRTLAEMSQHMKVTQHYTNIISQEQITSWRQNETGSETSNNNKHGKQSVQVRSLDDNQDDLSDKYNDSDREEDTYSHDDVDLTSDGHHQAQRNKHRNATLEQHNKSDSTDNNSTTDLSMADLSSGTHSKGSPSSTKPLTRSRRRENDTLPRKRDCGLVRDTNSPATSSSSQQRHNSGDNASAGSRSVSSSPSSNLGDLNREDTEVEFGTNANKECKTNGNSQESTVPTIRETSITPDELVVVAETTPVVARETNSETESDHNQQTDDDLPNTKKKKNTTTTKKDTSRKSNGFESPQKGADKPKELMDDHQLDDVDDDENDDDLVEDDANDDSGDNDEQAIEKSATQTQVAAAATTTTSANKADIGGPKGDTGDPLSALETMVEKSFDPRLRPGVANGGILQRLGIDEEVCPPWQHINYANWYAAAAYGHPMAAALLAAGINLQNGIKLSKNVGPKKNEE